MTAPAAPVAPSPQLGSPRRARRRAEYVWAVIDRMGGQAWTLVGCAAIVVAAGYLLLSLGWLLLPAGFAIVFGVLAAPLVTLLEQRGLRRLPATAIVFLGMAAVTTVVIWAMVPAFVEQASRLVAAVPEFLERIGSGAAAFERRYTAGNPAAAHILRTAGQGIDDSAVRFANGLSASLLDIVTVAFSAGFAGLLGTLIAFLAVKDLPTYIAPVSRWLDRPQNLRIAVTMRQMRRTLTSFIRGQMLKALIVGIISAIAYAMIGVPFSLPLAALRAFGTFIPTVGAVLASVPAVLLALAKGGPSMALVTLAVVIGIQLLDDYVLVPLIVGGAVELPALQVIVGITIAGGLFGIIGMVVAVPVIAMARDATRWLSMPENEFRLEAAKLKGP